MRYERGRTELHTRRSRSGATRARRLRDRGRARARARAHRGQKLSVKSYSNLRTRSRGARASAVSGMREGGGGATDRAADRCFLAVAALGAAAGPGGHGCAGTGRFALMPHRIDHKYEAWAWAQVQASGSQADGCNNCRRVKTSMLHSRSHVAFSVPCCPTLFFFHTHQTTTGCVRARPRSSTMRARARGRAHTHC